MNPFSAYVPCYSNATTFSQALSSLQRQSLPTSNLVLINDGSSDGSAAIALALGVDVGLDPSLQVSSGVSNTNLGVLERYWRWHAGEREQVSLSSYIRQVWYWLTVLVLRDIADSDLLAVPLSLFWPHYQFWKSWGRQISERVQS
jgi:hypothetical protein